MALGLIDKKAIVAEVQQVAKSAVSAVVADSRGVTVTDMTALRKLARENGVWLRVVRNTLARPRVLCFSSRVARKLGHIVPESATDLHFPAPLHFSAARSKP